jgi:hypothetical protein
MWRKDEWVDEPARLSVRSSRIAAWLLILVVLGVVVGAWGATLGRIVNAHDPSTATMRQGTFGVRQVFVASNTLGTTLAELPNCVYSQTVQGALSITNASTGSLLNEEQSANCTK